MGKGDAHTREAANGYGGSYRLLGNQLPEALRYRQFVRVNTEYFGEVNGVVDLMVAEFWGGLAKAKKRFEGGQHDPVALHVERKIVFQAPDGDWEEIRSLGPATWEEVEQWLSEFTAGHPPSPMPEESK